jgi:hypothetical protein
MNVRKLQHTQNEAATQREVSNAARTTRELNTVEEVLQADAARTGVPPEVGARLKQSIAREPAPPEKNWWQRLLGQ